MTSKLQSVPVLQAGLTERELLSVVAAYLSLKDGESPLNWDTFMNLAGYSSAQSARICFRPVQKKLRAFLANRGSDGGIACGNGTETGSGAASGPAANIAVQSSAACKQEGLPTSTPTTPTTPKTPKTPRTTKAPRPPGSKPLGRPRKRKADSVQGTAADEVIVKKEVITLASPAHSPSRPRKRAKMEPAGLVLGEKLDEQDDAATTVTVDQTSDLEDSIAVWTSEAM